MPMLSLSLLFSAFAVHCYTMPMRTLRLISSPLPVFAVLCCSAAVRFTSLHSCCRTSLNFAFPSLLPAKLSYANAEQRLAFPRLCNLLNALPLRSAALQYFAFARPRSATQYLTYAVPRLSVAVFSDCATHCSAIRNYAVAELHATSQDLAVANRGYAELCRSFALTLIAIAVFCIAKPLRIK